jgi:MoaA/NifB/PqqE/SkfB family radical SAM enzyme
MRKVARPGLRALDPAHKWRALIGKTRDPFHVGQGDYLTRAYLDELYEAGLRSMHIQVYLGNDDAYDHERTREQMREQIDKLKVEDKITIDRPGRRLEAKLTYRDMRLRIYGRNFADSGCDRGGTVSLPETSMRTSPCASPFYHVYIDFDGTVVPCCNIRSDIEEHRQHALGRLDSQKSIFEIYGSAEAAAWRRSLVGYESKTGVCASCSFVTFPKNDRRAQQQERLVQLSRQQT